MKTVKYYRKGSWGVTVIFAVFYVFLIIGFIYLPDSVKSFIFSIKNDSFNQNEIPIKTMRGVAYLLTIIVLPTGLMIAWPNTKTGNKEYAGLSEKRQVIMALSKTKINLLPVNIYPIDIPWDLIEEITIEKTWRGGQILVLSTPELKLDGYYKKFPIVKCDLSMVDANPTEVLEQIKKFHRFYRGYGNKNE